MNKLANTELFNLLIENSPEVSNTKMHKAYENFKEQVRNLNHAENDYSVVFRSLNSTRIEVMALQTFSLCEQGEKCVKKTLLPKSNLVCRIRN